MTEHNLKLDIKYWELVKSGEKGHEIRNNDRNFKAGDILNLKAYNSDGYYVKYVKLLDVGWCSVSEKEADTLTVKVNAVFYANFINEAIRDGKEKVGYFTNGFRTVLEVSSIKRTLREYFNTDRLPDDYVVLGIEV